MEVLKWHVLLFLLVIQFNFVINKIERIETGTKQISLYGFKDGLIIDLSQSGVTVQSRIQSILPGVLAVIQNDLKLNNSVKIAFIMTTPPNQSPSYVAIAQKELILSLGKFFPDSDISVCARPQMDLWGFLTQITFEVSLRRSGTEGGGKNQIRVEADQNIIIKPYINLIAEFRAMIVRLLPKIRADLETKSEVIFTINVEVSNGSKTGFQEKLQANLIAQLSTYFPDYDMSIGSKTETQQGGSIGAHFTVKLRRNCCGPKKLNGSDVTVITMIPGSTIESELVKYLTTILLRLQTLMSRGNPATFTVKIQTSSYLTREGLDDLRKQIMSVVSKYFQKARIDIALDGTGGPFDGIICKVDIYPKKDGNILLPPPYYEINLKVAGVKLTKAVDALFKRILPRSSKEMKKPFVFNILLIPTGTVDLKYVDQVVAEMTDMIHVHFPKCNVMIDAIIKENTEGGIVDILFEVRLQPDKKGNHVDKTPNWKKIVIDLMQSRDYLKAQIQSWIQGLISGSKNDLKNGISLGFQFEINTLKTTRKADMRMISSLIMSIVIADFPNLRVDMKEIDVQDEKGYIKDAQIKTFIHPEGRGGNLKKIEFPDRFIIDLNTPGTSIESLIMVKVIPKIFEMIEKFSKQDVTYKMQFVIKPPKASQEKYVRDVTVKIIDYLSKYLPEYFIEYISNGLTVQDNIEEIILSVVLVPGRSTVGGVILGDTSPFRFVHVIPGNFSENLLMIDEWLQTNMTQIFVELSKNPVSVEFRVSSSTGITMENEILKLDEIKELILNLFHHCNIRFGITGMKDKQGFVKQMIILITIEPVSSNPDIRECPPLSYPQGALPGIAANGTAFPHPNTESPRTDDQITPPPYSTIVPPGLTLEITPPTTQVKPPSANEFPTINVSYVPDIDIQTQIRPGLSNLIIDILSILKNGDPCDIPYFVQFPQGTNIKKIQDIVGIIKNIFEVQFPTDIVKVTLGDMQGYGNCITSAFVIVVVQPLKQPVSIIDMTNSSASISELVKKKFLQMEPIIRTNLDNAEKAGITINILRPSDEPAEFLLEIIQTLYAMIELKFPDIVCYLGIDDSDSKKIDISFEGIKKSKNSHGIGNVEIIVTIGGGEKSLLQRINDKLNSLYMTLKPLIEARKKVVLIINMELTSNEMSIQNIIEQINLVLKGWIPNVTVSIKPYFKRDLNKISQYVRLDVKLCIGSWKKNNEVIKIDLSDLMLSINAAMQNISPNMIAVVQKYLNLKEEITLNLIIIPPKRSVNSFVSRITEVVVPLISSSFCKTKTKWKIDTNNDHEGFLIDLNLSITFEPSQNSVRTGSKECQKSINIDIPGAGSRLDQELDKILPKIYFQITTDLEQGKPQILNLKFVAPPQSTNAYLNDASNSLLVVLQNYFPYNSVDVRIKANQPEAGYLLNVEIIATIQPDKNPLPQSDIEIPIDISQAGGVNVKVKMALKAHMLEIQNLLDQNSSVLIGFQINPPKGAKDDYLDTLTTEIFEAMTDLFSRKSIQTNTRATKNLKQEYFRIDVVVTLF